MWIFINKYDGEPGDLHVAFSGSEKGDPVPAMPGMPGMPGCTGSTLWIALQDFADAACHPGDPG